MAHKAGIPTMDWSSPDLAEALSLFKQKVELFLEDEEITNDEAKARKIKRGIGDEGLKRLNASGLTVDQQKKSKDLWDFFERQLKVNINFRIHRLHLMQYRQQQGESTDDFITRTRTLALKCDFGETELNERLVELVIASTPHEGLRKDLLGKPKGFTIAEMLVEGRKYEALAAGQEQLQHLGGQNIDVHAHSYSKERTCSKCDTIHKPRQCPAYHDNCNFCGTKGHWERCCRKKKRQGQQKDGKLQRRHQAEQKNPNRKGPRHRRLKKVDAVESEYESDEETYQKEFYGVTTSVVNDLPVVTPSKPRKRSLHNTRDSTTRSTWSWLYRTAQN